MGYTPPSLQVVKVTGGWKIYSPSNTSTDDLYIYPNGTDTTPSLILLGTGALQIGLPAGQALSLLDNGVNSLNMAYIVGDSHMAIISKIDAKDLYLGTTGTGVLKFGTYTAGAATDSTGYITIKDAAGNTRKLMVQA